MKEIRNQSATVVPDLISLLTHYGLLTEEQIYKSGQIMDNSRLTKEAIRFALEKLTTDGLVAEFEADGSKQHFYGLIENCYKIIQSTSLKKQMIATAGNFNISNIKKLKKEEADAILASNEAAFCYVIEMMKQLEDKAYQIVRSSAKRFRNTYTVSVAYENHFYKCVLAWNENQIGTITGDNLLLVSDEKPAVPENAPYEKIFLFRRKKLSLLWSEEESKSEPEPVTETTVSEPEPVPETPVSEPEPEPVPETPVSEPESKKKPRPKRKPKSQPEPEEETQLSLFGEEMFSQPEETPIGQKAASAFSDVEFCQKIMNALTAGNCLDDGNHAAVLNALLLAKAASLLPSNTGSLQLYKQLLLATDLKTEPYVGKSDFLSDVLSDAFPDVAAADESLLFAAYAYALLIPGINYDFGLYDQTAMFLKRFDEYFPSLHFAKNLFSKIFSIHETLPMGFTPSVIAKIGDSAQQENLVKNLCAQAAGFMNLPNVAQLRALAVMYPKAFGKGSNFYECMEIISENRTADSDLVFSILEEFSDKNNGICIISEEKIEAALERDWHSAVTKNKKYELKDYKNSRTKALNSYRDRLNVMKSWTEHVSSQTEQYDIDRLKTLHQDILSLIEQAQQDCLTCTAEYRSILVWIFDRMKRRLTVGLPGTAEDFAPLLHTGIIPQDENGIPILDKAFIGIRFYEPWDLAEQHIQATPLTLHEAEENILALTENDLTDNIGQLNLIYQLRGETPPEVNNVVQRADDVTTNFRQKLELDYTYDRIDEIDKETILFQIDSFRNFFYEKQLFGCWRQFLHALEKQMDTYAASKKKGIEEAIEKSRHKIADGIVSGERAEKMLDEAERLLFETGNFAVAEEYITRFNNNDFDFLEDLNAVLGKKDIFAEFTSDEIYEPIQNICSKNSGNNFRVFGEQYVRTRYPAEWTSRQKDDSKEFMLNWPIGKKNTTEDSLKKLFFGMGFDVITVRKKDDGQKRMTTGAEYFQLDVKPVEKRLSDYMHPISDFGTKLRSPLDVIVFYGNMNAQEMVQVISEMNPGKMAVVLVNRAYSRMERRQIGYAAHTQSGHNPFIMIDQVLAVYLALHVRAERIPTMLSCTLPYTKYQPFGRDNGSVPDEMFFGRTKELHEIKEFNGVNVVYGGRQLGKTALLQRAESLQHKPEMHEYAVYCNIDTSCSETEAAEKIVQKINKNTGLNFAPCDTLKDLCTQFETYIREGKIVKFLLLLDETDNFLASIANDKYRQLNPLIELVRERQDNFKLVLAGLHNAARAKNATSENGRFGQVGTPLCIKPLSPAEAMELLSRPLHYLGFRLDAAHLETIITRTNYYPGILQFFGYKLVETLKGEYSKYYNASENPPYLLNDSQLGDVMNSNDLNRSIQDKFRLTLELDDRYFMIARCIAMLHYVEGGDSSRMGYHIDEIMEYAKDIYAIHCLKDVDTDSFRTLLDEMVDMGILSSPDYDVYRMRRRNFYSIIGADDKAVERDIEEKNKKAMPAGEVKNI